MLVISVQYIVAALFSKCEQPRHRYGVFLLDFERVTGCLGRVGQEVEVIWDLSKKGRFAIYI